MKMKIFVLILSSLIALTLPVYSAKGQSEKRILEQEKIPNSFTVRDIEIEGNTVISEKKLKNQVENFIGQKTSLNEAQQIAESIVNYYAEKGYFLTIAYLPLQNFKNGKVKIKIVEGAIQKINVKIIKGALSPEYIEKKLNYILNKPITNKKLTSALAVLKRNRFILDFDYEVIKTENIPFAILEIKAYTESQFRLLAITDNKSSPFTGVNSRIISAGLIDTFAAGDELFGAFQNTNGSNVGSLVYKLPLLKSNSELSFIYSTNNNDVIANPFAQVDPRTNFQFTQLQFSKGILNNLNNDLKFDFSISRASSQNFLLNEGFPTSRGADSEGVTTQYALRFAQEYIRTNTVDRFTINSQFVLGIDVLDTAIDQSFSSEYFLWRAKTEYLRLLSKNTRLVINSGFQLSPNRLTGIEQFAIGGVDSIRGYRSYFANGDNGGFASSELRISVAEPKEGHTLQIIPFLDFGAVGNNQEANEQDNIFLSIGAEARYTIDRKFQFKFGYGKKLIENPLNNVNNTLQEQGGYFSVSFRFF